MRPRFGPAGRPPWFRCKMTEVPLLLEEEGLDAFEFQAVRMGMPDRKVGADRAGTLRENAERCDVWVTLHAPYFVNLASEKGDTYERSIERLVSSMRLASWMGAHQVVFHPGYYGGLSRREALDACVRALRRVIDAAREDGIKDVWLGPETTGKASQVGDLEEVVAMCESVEQTRPTVDFAHIHARGAGRIRTKGDYAEILDLIEDRLGADVVGELHCHYTPVEYTEKGEVRHHPMGEAGFGPDFEPLAELIVERGISPVIISESPILDKDSIRMRDIVLRRLRG
ncbi:TPA: deoxyribonuclease IV [Candidatus Bathyarchaeota archaeon]|nr:deoxyribonuclease IV [Candidatus Bathyarchaeota archaeon]